MLDFVKPVAVVGHHAKGVIQSTLRNVGTPIDPFQTCAVTQVKSRYRIDRAAGRVSAIGQEPLRCGKQFGRQKPGLALIIPPTWHLRVIGSVNCRLAKIVLPTALRRQKLPAV